MKPASIALAVLASVAFAHEASAQQTKRIHSERHCKHCTEVTLYRCEKQQVTRCEDVLAGYQDEIVGYEDVTVCQDVVVGYEDVCVERQVTVYETRTVWKRVYTGRDCCGRPIYRCVPVCERVPVCRTEWVCEKRPIVEKRPIIEKRPIVEKRPVYEKREVVTCEWVKVPYTVYVCFR